MRIGVLITHEMFFNRFSRILMEVHGPQVLAAFCNESVPIIVKRVNYFGDHSPQLS